MRFDLPRAPRLLAVGAILLFVTARGDEGTGGGAAEDSVVQVFSTMRDPDFSKPWTKQAPREVTGSGVIIEGRRILTNAHLVRYASEIQIQASHSGDKVSATVEAVSPAMDLALLKVDDPTVFDAHPPLKREARLPSVKDTVLVYGFPTGGPTLSITKGIVSRIDFVGYNYPASGLRVQVDAAINPGNSGGPAVVGDKMVGLVFSTLGGTQNIGYIIPCEEIQLFLADAAQGKSPAKPALFDEFQTLENEALRASLKLDKSVQGAVVHRPDRDEPSYPLKQWDVVSKIGDAAVDNQGMVTVDGLRLAFPYLVQKVSKDGRVPLTIWRGGREMAVQVPVSSTHPLVLVDLRGAYPPYFIYGPLVFSTASTQFLGALGAGKGTVLGMTVFNGSPLITRRGDRPAFPGEELVLVSSPLFPHKLAKGYSNPQAHVVKAVNGAEVKNLRHLVEILRDAQGDFVTFEFYERHTEAIVLPRKEAVRATEEILNDNGIRSQGSPDTLDVWNARAGATSSR
ncbi:MAG TPA: trypsin-like peptidase domain-containing protein [Anaeromyxobacteraceae bacterium]|nr:trypsin-like peptidase domain-containing protein [Anaeromyxobacteraceae bacterium]